MNRLHHLRTRRGTVAALTGALALLALGTIAPLSAQATVSCTETISGPHSGVITVAGGQKLCLDGAVQDGAVNVDPGGALSVTNKSIITGAVTLKSGFVDLEFCDSTTVRGAISATGSLGDVKIGGTGSSELACPANDIDGAVTLEANNGGIQLGKNMIAGEVTASGNLGGPLGEAGTTISGNQIGGALTCTGNIPAPNNAGVTNTVSGSRSGQTCAVTTF
jgi:hexosaminidase